MRAQLLAAMLVYLGAALDCPLKPILKGVSVKQDLGATHKKIYPAEPDCKAKCASETDFNCTAIMWPGGEALGGDCYLFDKVDVTREIFVDQRTYFLYVSVCEGDKTPSIGYCEFLLTQSGVTATSAITFITPGATTESSCYEFCIANYLGQDCNAFVVSAERASTCTLYSSIPSTLTSGPQNLWTKKCSAPPVNCGYAPWSEWAQCSVSCGNGTRTRGRTVATQPSKNGVQCVESEKSETGDCGTQACNADCMYTDWSTFGACNATCASTGFRSRNRGIAREALSGGAACSAAAKVEVKECASTEECNKPCIYSTWSEWTTCTDLCQASRVRQLEMGDPTNCEIEHGPLTNTMVCEGGFCNSNPGQGTSTTTPKPTKTTKTGGGVTQVTPTTKSGSGVTQPSGGQTTTTKSGGGNNGGTTTTAKTGGGGNTGGGNNGGTTTTATNGGTPIPEKGCRIDNIDPSGHPSSLGYKAVGARSDCALMCQQETTFKCEAYITTGPGGPCVLHGAIDRNVTKLQYSKYYLQDIQCKANTSPTTGICEWKMTKSGINPSFAAPGNFDSIGLTIDAPHCATLCMMNHPIFRPNPCQAYAWNPLIGFTSGRDNCFMYNWAAVANSTQGGEFDLYQLICP